EVEIMQVLVEPAWQRPGRIRRHVIQEVILRLIKAYAQPGMRLDHPYPGLECDEAKLIRVEFPPGAKDRNEPFVNPARNQPDQPQDGGRSGSCHPPLPRP